MFKAALRSKDASPERINIWVNGEPVRIPAGLTLAAALLEAGVHTFRYTAVSGQPRGPLCMMGVCFECLVEVDGVPNQQACMQEVVPGMRVRLQTGAPSLEATP